MKKQNAIKLYCSCGWSELVAVDATLTPEDAWKKNCDIQIAHMKTHEVEVSKDTKWYFSGRETKLIN